LFSTASVLEEGLRWSWPRGCDQGSQQGQGELDDHDVLGTPRVPVLSLFSFSFSLSLSLSLSLARSPCLTRLAYRHRRHSLHPSLQQPTLIIVILVSLSLVFLECSIAWLLLSLLVILHHPPPPSPLPLLPPPLLLRTRALPPSLCNYTSPCGTVMPICGYSYTQLLLRYSPTQHRNAVFASWLLQVCSKSIYHCQRRTTTTATTITTTTTRISRDRPSASSPVARSTLVADLMIQEAVGWSRVRRRSPSSALVVA